jgi:hypothetical protein
MQVYVVECKCAEKELTMNPLCSVMTGAFAVHDGEDRGSVTRPEVISNPISSVDAAGRDIELTAHGGCQLGELGEALQPHAPVMTSKRMQI